MRRLRSADVAEEGLHVLEDASGESQGVEEPELVAECGRMLVDAAMVANEDETMDPERSAIGHVNSDQCSASASGCCRSTKMRKRTLRQGDK